MGHVDFVRRRLGNGRHDVQNRLVAVDWQFNRRRYGRNSLASRVGSGVLGVGIVIVGIDFSHGGNEHDRTFGDNDCSFSGLESRAGISRYRVECVARIYVAGLHAAE